MSITTRASKFIKKQTEKIFNQEDINRKDDIMAEVDLIEDDCKKSDEKSSTALARLNNTNAKDLLEKKLRDVRSNKRNTAINNRLDEIERRLHGIENDIEDDEKGIINNEDLIELLSHRTEACETRIRVVEDRVQKLEKDSKKIYDNNDAMDKLLKNDSYAYLYLNVKTSLKWKLQKRNDSVTKKCLLSLSSFIGSLMFVWINTEGTLLIASLLILFTALIGLSSIMQNTRKWFKFLKLKHSCKTYNITILEYLKGDLDLYISLKEKKKEMGNCNELIDFNELINMEKESIKKNTVNVIVTLIVILVFFVFLNIFLYNNTSSTFLEIMKFPFSILTKVLAI
jgi:hypothetical protein